jgi:hypothetical protein
MFATFSCDCEIRRGSLTQVMLSYQCTLSTITVVIHLITRTRQVHPVLWIWEQSFEIQSSKWSRSSISIVDHAHESGSNRKLGCKDVGVRLLNILVCNNLVKHNRAVVTNNRNSRGTYGQVGFLCPDCFINQTIETFLITSEFLSYVLMTIDSNKTRKTNRVLSSAFGIISTLPWRPVSCPLWTHSHSSQIDVQSGEGESRMGLFRLVRVHFSAWAERSWATPIPSQSGEVNRTHSIITQLRVRLRGQSNNMGPFHNLRMLNWTQRKEMTPSEYWRQNSGNGFE